MWPLPSVAGMRARKVARLLKEFPISTNLTNVSVDIKTDSLDRRLMLESVFKNESLCFNNLEDAQAEKITIINGNAKFLSTFNRHGNETLFIIPTSNIDDIVMSGKHFL